MPTVLCYVLCLTSVSGFESHCLATQSGLQRKSAPVSPEICETCPYFAIIPNKPTAENGLLSGEGVVTVVAFLRRDIRSPVSKWSGRMQCDHKPGIRALRVDS